MNLSNFWQDIALYLLVLSVTADTLPPSDELTKPINITINSTEPLLKSVDI